MMRSNSDFLYWTSSSPQMRMLRSTPLNTDAGAFSRVLASSYVSPATSSTHLQVQTTKLDAMVEEKKSVRAPKKFMAGFLAHWQIVASAVLLGAGVTGLAATYEDYCGMTDLAYAPAEVRDELQRASEESGVRTGVLASQLETESHWRVGVASHAGAQGLAQFTPETWEMWGQGGKITDPEDSIKAQGHYLAYLRERLAPLADSEDELVDLMLAGYNAGPGAVEHYKGIPPYGETQEYVKKIDALASSKYKVTCDPDPQFSQAQISYPVTND